MGQELVMNFIATALYININHLLVLLPVAIVFIYSFFYYFTGRLKHGYSAIAFWICLAVWLYVALARNFMFHVMGYFFLMILVFIAFYKNENSKFLHYFFMQFCLVIVSYIIMSIYFLESNGSGANPYSAIDIASIVIKYPDSEVWRRFFLFIGTCCLIFSSFTFSRMNFCDQWLEKAGMYYLCITRIPLIFIIHMFYKNFAPVHEVLRSVFPVIGVILLFSTGGIAVTRSNRSLLNHSNNFFVSIFLILLSTSQAHEVHRLYQYFLIINFLILYVIVYYFRRYFNVFTVAIDDEKYSEKNMDLRGKSEVDLIYDDKDHISDKIFLYWIILLIPGGAGFYMVLYGLEAMSELSVILTVLFSVLYYVSILKMAVKMIEQYLDALKKDSIADGGLKLNYAVYPLLAINILFALYEVVWSRIFLK